MLEKIENRKFQRLIKSTLVGIALIFAIFLFTGCDANVQSQQTTQQQTFQTKEIKVTEKIPFETKEQADSNLDKDKTETRQEGVDGEKVITFEITLKNGQEISRKQLKEEITKKPIDKIIAKGTKEKVTGSSGSGTSCSGGYINVGGNCVKSPSNDPAGATARCRDGTYSYSQNRSGTCSHHGGVAQWLQ